MSYISILFEGGFPQFGPLSLFAFMYANLLLLYPLPQLSSYFIFSPDLLFFFFLNTILSGLPLCLKHLMTLSCLQRQIPKPGMRGPRGPVLPS